MEWCGFTLTESEFRAVAIHALGGDSILTEWNQDDLLIDTIRSYVFGAGDKTPHKEVTEEGLATSQAFFEAIINIATIDNFEIFEKEGVEHFFTKNVRKGANSKDAFLDFMYVVQKESHGDLSVVVKNIERCLSAVNKMVEKYSNGIVVSTTTVNPPNGAGAIVTP